MVVHPPETRQLSGRPLAVLLALTLATLVPLLDIGAARADTAPPDTATSTTVSSDPLPTAQIDGVVWSQAVAGSTVYAGGQFTKARPPGAAPGAQTVDRANLLAYDVTTGQLVSSFAPVLNGVVKAVAASPDGAAVYVAGTFTTVNGLTRNRIAAFNTATGALLPFAPVLNYTAASLAVTETTVYVGGGFSSVGATTRRAIAALDRGTGVLRTAFAPKVPTGSVLQVIVSPDRSKVVLGGSFDTVNDSANPGYGLALLNAQTGQSLPMPVNNLIRNARTNAAIDALTAAPDGFYGGGYAVGKVDGNLEGLFKADWQGNLIWVEDCHGDTYSAFAQGDAVYLAGHPHYCGNIGGFPQTDPWTFQRAMAVSREPAAQKISREPLGYFNFEGQPRPDLLTWFPDFNVGTFTGKSQGPWHVTGNDDYVVFGGEFTSVNYRNQQGLVRFARTGIAPNVDGPRLSGSNYRPLAQQFSDGVRLSWPANHDRDNEQLTYGLIKNGDTNTPIFTTTARSTFWRRPNLAHLDTAVAPGQTHTYRLRVSDPAGNVSWGDPITVTATGGGAVLNPVDRAALLDGPQAWWPLNETAGTAVADLAGTATPAPATRTSAVGVGVPGVSGPGTAFRFPGTSGATVSTTTARLAPQVFSVEAWFKTTSTAGGKVIGFGNLTTGDSGSIDRQIYLGNSGRVNFGVYPMQQRVVSSPGAYNDGRWHHVVGTLSPAGQHLYVDGQLVGSRTDTTSAQISTGYWRVGGDRVNGWAGAGTSGYLAGDIDNPAVYPVALSPAQIQAHHAAAGGPTPNAAPTATFTSQVNQLAVSVDGSTSSDPDGTIATYAWNFGDGSTASGATPPAHTYPAAGTYQVRLTITDDDGAVDSVTHPVTVTAPGPGPGPGPNEPFVDDQFQRTLATGLGTADVGGAWTVSASAGFAVSGGAGQVKLSTPGASRSAFLGATTRTSTDLTSRMVLDKAAAGGTIMATQQSRRITSTTVYQAATKVTTTGKISVTLEALKGSTTATPLAPAAALPTSYTAGTVINTRLQTFGTSPSTVRVKLWLGDAPEPTAWTSQVTDSFAGLQAPGAVGVIGYLSGSATNAPVTLSMLDLTARPVVE